MDTYVRSFTWSGSLLYLLEGLLCMYLTCAVSENDKSEPNCMAFRALCVGMVVVAIRSLFFLCFFFFVSFSLFTFYTTSRELFFSSLFSACFFLSSFAHTQRDIFCEC